MVDGLSMNGAPGAAFRRDPQGSVPLRSVGFSPRAKLLVSVGWLGSSAASPQPARLLVSVRNADEAAAALDGGAEIIDIKEPARGPLGMADVAVISDVIDCVAGRVPVSAALGEVSDWLSASTATGVSLRSTPATPFDLTAIQGATGSARAFPALPAGLSFAKLGLAGMHGRTDWGGDWIRVRTAFEAASGVALPWVAVAYADARTSGTPSVEEIISAATRTGCCGVLIDTHDKSSGSLLQLQPASAFRRWQAQAHACGLFFAVAGKLRATDLQRDCIRTADVVGVRSAACSGGDRRAAVAADQVAALRRRLRSHSDQRDPVDCDRTLALAATTAIVGEALSEGQS